MIVEMLPRHEFLCLETTLNPLRGTDSVAAKDHIVIEQHVRWSECAQREGSSSC